jgi:hypothetical protein
VLGCAFVWGDVCAQDVRVRAHLEAPQPLWVGQRATFVVELLAPGYFASAVSFDLPDPAGIVLLPPGDHPVVGGEAIDDVSYTVQRHEVGVYPMRPGALSVPEIHVRFQWKRAPLDKDLLAAAVKTEAVTLAVERAPGTADLGAVICARDLKAEESFSPVPGDAEVEAGAAFVRTVTVEAPDVPGMLLPVFPAPEVEGLGVYAERSVHDETERGSLQGQRRDVVTYVCKRPGQYLIPAARIRWFDLASKQVQTKEFPAVALRVKANPAMASASASRPKHWAGIAAWLGGIALALALASSARIRRALLRVLAPFRPVHLAPLNPTERTASR